jgi:peptidoglycan/xylan/chitin deacetylase (PgdA/CDA1 family)
MLIKILNRKLRNGIKYIIDMSKYKCQCMLQKKLFSYDDRYVFMFHNITNDVEALKHDEYSISAKKIIMIVKTLQQNGYKFVSPNEILKGEGKKILLTFDDAYAGVYYDLFHLFKKMDIPFTVFQTVEFIGKDKYLTDEMIRELLKYEKFTLGAHTLTHCTLANFDKNNINNEIAESKNILEAKYNIKVSCLAYPYGDFTSINHNCIDTARNNFDMAFSTIQCGVKRKYRIGLGKYIIPRINFNENNALGIVDSILLK